MAVKSGRPTDRTQFGRVFSGLLQEFLTDSSFLYEKSFAPVFARLCPPDRPRSGGVSMVSGLGNEGLSGAASRDGFHGAPVAVHWESVSP